MGAGWRGGGIFSRLVLIVRLHVTLDVNTLLLC